MFHLSRKLLQFGAQCLQGGCEGPPPRRESEGGAFFADEEETESTWFGALSMFMGVQHHTPYRCAHVMLPHLYCCAACRKISHCPACIRHLSLLPAVYARLTVAKQFEVGMAGSMNASNA